MGGAGRGGTSSTARVAPLLFFASLVVCHFCFGPLPSLPPRPPHAPPSSPSSPSPLPAGVALGCSGQGHGTLGTSLDTKAYTDWSKSVNGLSMFKNRGYNKTGFERFFSDWNVHRVVGRGGPPGGEHCEQPPVWSGPRPWPRLPGLLGIIPRRLPRSPTRITTGQFSAGRPLHTDPGDGMTRSADRPRHPVRGAFRAGRGGARLISRNGARPAHCGPRPH